jgi:hypothetical protein
MSVTIKTKWIILAICIVALVLFFGGWLVGTSVANRASRVLISGKDKQLDSMYIVLKDRQFYAYEIEQDILTLKDAINRGLVEKETLKALNLKYISEVTTLKGQVRILKDSIEHNGNVIIIQPCDTTLPPKPAIELPFSFKEHNKWYQLDGTFNNTGKLNVLLTVPLEIDVYTGYNKTSKEYQAIVTTDNPNVIFNGVRSLKLDLKNPPKYNVSIFLGYGMSVQKNPTLSPFIGVGVGRSLIRF